MPIKLLPLEVSSKIAAGEIIERPASVVKELVENSLDAGASQVSVEIRDGGMEYIRVADSGAGIAASEVETAFQRFATSKLSQAEDLTGIGTLGFRGEALPSIAAVASVALVSRVASADAGVHIDVDGGEVGDIRSEGAAAGTSVTVRNLFRHLPARREFLRSAGSEAAQVQTVTTRYAMACPGVKFDLDIDGSTAFSSPGSDDLREVVSAVYGSSVAADMLELESSDADDPAVSGMISPPSVTRANRSQITIFVNGRWVQVRMLAYALEQAYHGFLMERRFPIGVVYLDVPTEELDVNVHPAKTEVRFRQQGRVFSALQRAVRQTLIGHSPVPEVSQAATPQPVGARPSAAPPVWPGAPADRLANGPAAPAQPAGANVHGHPDIAEPFPAAQPLVPQKALPALRVLGQVKSTYIAAEGPDGVYLIDQHAAHERIVFEEVSAEIRSQTPRVQSLLEPATVELDHRQAELLESQLELLSGAGFHLEPFGTRTYILRGVPQLLSSGDPQRALLDVLDMMSDGGGFESWEERAAYSVACHGAIRAGMTLSGQEMSELTRQLESCQQPHSCPHGRPTMVHMSSARLEREFGRR